MEVSSATPTPKLVFFQDLWSEISGASLYFSEIIYATVLFCTLFNHPGASLWIGTWLAVLGFGTYIIARVAGYLISNHRNLLVINSIWFLSALILFSRFVLNANSDLPLWEILVNPFTNLSQQPVLQSQLWQLFFLVLLLRRGFTLAGSLTNSWRAVQSFQLGMLVYFFFGFTTTWDNFFPNLVPFLLYLLFAITSLTTSRLASLSNQTGYKFPGFQKSWFAWISALTFALILLGSSLGWLTGVAFVNLTDWLLRIGYGVIVSLLILLFSPLIALLGLLLPWLDKLIASLVGKQFGLEQLQLIQSLNNPEPARAAQVNIVVNQVVTIILILALVITMILVIISVRWRAGQNRSTQSDDLISRAAERKLGRSHGFHLINLLSGLDKSRRWLAAARIRRVYQNLMQYCEKLDNPRLPAFTPHEFLPQLVSLFPQHVDQVTMLTDVYQQVRYGEIPESLDELQQIIAGWNIIKIEADVRIRERRKRLSKN